MGSALCQAFACALFYEFIIAFVTCHDFEWVGRSSSGDVCGSGCDAPHTLREDVLQMSKTLLREITDEVLSNVEPARVCDQKMSNKLALVHDQNMSST